MPNARLYPVAARHNRQPYAPAPPAGRLFGLALVALGLLALALASAPLLVAGAQSAPTTAAFADPGLRGGQPRAGGPIAGLSASEVTFFKTTATDTFKEIDSVGGTEPGAAGVGLGPRFNMNSCAGCHAQPAAGGSSPFVNPQVAVASEYGAQNYVPWFITGDGPVREVRFKRNPDGSPDGGVHDLFTINGRHDAPGCGITQGSFSNRDNIIFRIPTPTFGAGLIEAIPDSTIVDNKNNDAANKALRGISGHENREGNTGTVTRFGWKAQNKSLDIFSGEAYNVEQGVTNEVFPNERDETPSCQFNGIPEDHTTIGGSGVEAASDVIQFGMFMRFLAPPTPLPASASTESGKQLFNTIGCGMCHTPSMQTGKAANPALDHKTVNLYSDLLDHNMGSNLADGISQGNAGADEFRSAPLWGLGQRIFFLHDGRTKNLVEAIQMHAGPGSEANTVIGYFNSLPAPQKQDLLNFLRSL